MKDSYRPTAFEDSYRFRGFWHLMTADIKNQPSQVLMHDQHGCGSKRLIPKIDNWNTQHLPHVPSLWCLKFFRPPKIESWTPLTGQTYKLDCLMALLGWLSHLVGKSNQVVLHHCPIPGRLGGWDLERLGLWNLFLSGFECFTLEGMMKLLCFGWFNVADLLREESKMYFHFTVLPEHGSPHSRHLIVGIHFTGWIDSFVNER